MTESRFEFLESTPKVVKVIGMLDSEAVASYRNTQCRMQTRAHSEDTDTNADK